MRSDRDPLFFFFGPGDDQARTLPALDWYEERERLAFENEERERLAFEARMAHLDDDQEGQDR